MLNVVIVLVLRLAGVLLIERVRHVERRPRRLDVQVERVVSLGVRVEPVEERQAVARVVQRRRTPADRETDRSAAR